MPCWRESAKQPGGGCLELPPFRRQFIPLFCLGLPESPRWLLSRKGNRETALQVLRRVEPDHTSQEISKPRPTRSRLRPNGASLRWTFLDETVAEPILLAILIAFFNQLSGINAICTSRRAFSS